MFLFLVDGDSLAYISNQNKIQKHFFTPRGEIACVTAAPIQSPRNMQKNNNNTNNNNNNNASSETEEKYKKCTF